jgi:hypothetical protein
MKTDVSPIAEACAFSALQIAARPRNAPPDSIHWLRSVPSPFEQLEYVGAIAILYNSVEDQVDSLCAEGLRIPIHDAEVLSRLNGIEGKAELAKISAKHWGFSEDEQAFLAEALGKSGFMLLKKWRDAVVHSRVYNSRTSMAVVPERRGKFSQVLLSTDALVGLYSRLAWIRAELFWLRQILERRTRLSREWIDTQHRERLEQQNRADWIRAREHRTHRLSLQPMPEFPDGIPDDRPPEEGQ